MRKETLTKPESQISWRTRIANLVSARMLALTLSGAVLATGAIASANGGGHEDDKCSHTETTASPVYGDGVTGHHCHPSTTEGTTPDTTPEDTTPEDTTPNDTTPNETTPDTTPEVTTPEDTTPEVTTPEDTTPVSVVELTTTTTGAPVTLVTIATHDTVPEFSE